MSDRHKVLELIQESQKNGFIVKKCSKGVKLFHRDRKVDILTIHIGKRALHPLRKFLKKHSGFLME
jgi:hypothetical protein